MLLVDDIQRLKSVSMSIMLLSPKSTIGADAGFAGFAEDTHFLVVESTCFLLWSGRDWHFLFESMQIVQNLNWKSCWRCLQYEHSES